VLGGQFPQEAYETIGMSAAEIDKVKKVRKQAALDGNDQTMFRKLFKREMHTTVVTNIKKVGLLNERTSGFLRDIGIDPTLGQNVSA
jgi:saccharopine dehydrogenase-like NADP-dependent oxidoreductase